MPDQSEYEDFDQFLQSAGWRRFQEMVAKDWGTSEGGGARFVAAVTKAANLLDDATSTAQLRQVVVTQREIQTLMRGPVERFESLKRSHVRPEPMPKTSRRGRL